jgi:hypothetical protein
LLSAKCPLGIVLPEQFYRHKKYYQQERRQLMITVIASIRAIRSIDDEIEFDHVRGLAVCYFDARGLTGSGFDRCITVRGVTGGIVSVQAKSVFRGNLGGVGQPRAAIFSDGTSAVACSCIFDSD